MLNFILNSVDSANDDIEGYKRMKEKGMGSHSDFELRLYSQAFKKGVNM